MTPTPPSEPSPETTPPADPAAGEAAAPEAASSDAPTPAPEAPPKRRWLPRRRTPDPAPADDAPEPSPSEPVTAAIPEAPPAIPEATTPGPPEADGPRRLRRNRKRILSQREVAVYDLGGLAFELYRRDLLTEEVMVRRAREVAELDDTVRDIDARLTEMERERRERRAKAPADPSVGCCMVCRASFRADARYCSHCGAEVAPPAAGDEQPTVAIPTPPPA